MRANFQKEWRPLCFSLTAQFAVEYYFPRSRTFTYDLVDRLKTVTSSDNQNESYSYDHVGNRTSSHLSTAYGYQTGQFNQLTSTATATYGYDPNGNTASKSEGSDLWRYTWDHENRLTRAATRKQAVRYKYDALGRRVQRIVGFGKENTKFIYDGEDALVDDNGGTLTKYQNGLGIDNKLRVQTGGTVNYFLSDHLGSTNGLADATGAVTASTSYDSFGNATNANFPSRYQFTGRENDSLTSMYYYRARFFDTNLGRFVSEDPIKFRGGINWYAYVGNNPLFYVDPLGLCPPNDKACSNSPKSWEKPQFDTGPYANPNPFTSIENGDVSSFWHDPFGTFSRAVSFYCYNFPIKGFLGDLGINGSGLFGKSAGGVPGAGEMMNSLELGPDLYNTIDTLDRRNQDYNDAIRCASGNCSLTPYTRGGGLGGANNGWRPRPPE